MRKGKGMEARLRYGVRHWVENGHHRVAVVETEAAASVPDRAATLGLLSDFPEAQRITVGSDKGYDTRDFVEQWRATKITPHVAHNTGRRGGSALDGRTTRHAGYAVRLRKRTRVETAFG